MLPIDSCRCCCVGVAQSMPLSFASLLYLLQRTVTYSYYCVEYLCIRCRTTAAVPSRFLVFKRYCSSRTARTCKFNKQEKYNDKHKQVEAPRVQPHRGRYIRNGANIWSHNHISSSYHNIPTKKSCTQLCKEGYDRSLFSFDITTGNHC